MYTFIAARVLLASETMTQYDRIMQFLRELEVINQDIAATIRKISDTSIRVRSIIKVYLRHLHDGTQHYKSIRATPS
jgi:hypothetical protein